MRAGAHRRAVEEVACLLLHTVAAEKIVAEGALNDMSHETEALILMRLADLGGAGRRIQVRRDSAKRIGMDWLADTVSESQFSPGAGEDKEMAYGLGRLPSGSLAWFRGSAESGLQFTILTAGTDVSEAAEFAADVKAAVDPSVPGDGLVQVLLWHLEDSYGAESWDAAWNRTVFSRSLVS